MNNLLIEKLYGCPYCGEQINTFIDTSQDNQLTIEDCSICCKPIELSVFFEEGNQTFQLIAKTDSD